MRINLINMKFVLLAGVALATSIVRLGAAESPLQGSVTRARDVKTYLLEAVTRVRAASEAFVENAAAYAKAVEAAGGDYLRAAAGEKSETRKLIAAMQENYKAMDSFGYETVEGIVGGVEQLAPFDVYLDSGVARTEASSATPVAPVVIRTASGRVIDHEGSLFTSLIEPVLWGSNRKYTVPLDLNGDGVTGARENVPDANILVALAADTHKKIAELAAASEAWQPTIEDCFSAIITMTPTLSGYFDDWKESRYAKESSGKFLAVSRVSDMRGIMSSVAVLYRAVHANVERQDAALARAIDRGFHDILSFIDRVEAREKKREITAAEIDELGNKAREKADKLVPQVEQAAAVLQINLQRA